MHPRWLLSLFCLYSSVLCKPHPVANLEYRVTYPVYLRGKSDNRNVIKQLLIPIDLTNTLQYAPNQLINRPQSQPHVVLENKPTHFFHQAQAAMQSTKAKPQTDLEYQPNWYPNSDGTINEMVSPGQIWPASKTTIAPTTEITTTTSTTLPTTSTDQATLVARLDEGTTKKSSISLEYQPVRPFFHPKPGNNIGQIIPPGKPWPSSAEDYKTSVPPTLEERLKETTVESSTTQKTASSSTTQKTASNSQSISLEYKPMKPFYYPSSGTMVGQIVPPGKPWPANPEDYANFSQTTSSVVNRIKDTSITTESTQSSTARTTSITLDYKPTRPFYHPIGGNNVAQIIPPGKPWPASAEGYQNFSQTAVPNRIEGTTSKIPEESSVVNRIKETTTTESSRSSTSSITLDYKPTRPFYHPNGGNNIAQIIPSGKPWPSSAEGYQNFSQTAVPNRIKGTSTEKPQESSITTTTQTSTTSEKFTQTPLALDRVKETVSTTPQGAFNWENVKDIGGLSLFTSKPEKTTPGITTLEVSTEGPLYTSSLTEISKGLSTEKMMEKLPPLRVVPFLVPPKI